VRPAAKIFDMNKYPVFFWVSKFRPGKYDFELYKGYFHEKTGPDSSDNEK
jgi:hypothetical protein